MTIRTPKQKTIRQKKATIGASHGHAGPFRIAACWPHQQCPLILSMVGDGHVFVATSFTPISLQSIQSQKVQGWKDCNIEPEISRDLPRWLILLPYDSYLRHSTVASATVASSTLASSTSERPLAWEVKAGLVWNHGSSEPRYVSRRDASSARFHLEWGSQLKDLIYEAKKFAPVDVRPIALRPATSDDTYLESVRSIIRGIQAGDFYQVNVLRYFHALNAHGWQNICALMELNSGPQGALISQGSRVVASFSPEKFIGVENHDGQFEISTWPIKGTAARDLKNEKKDHEIGVELEKSQKDLAELRMIIDLMRNDLSKICVEASVQVVSSGTLKKFSHVWHLEGHIRGELKAEETLGEILAAVCPGGSITGAPKLAAMDRISEEEGQPRGYFMGNFLRINHDGSLQSNILIRTMISEDWMKSGRYAAGSGLVIKSEPEKELAEIKSKCATITEISHSEGRERSDTINEEIEYD